MKRRYKDKVDRSFIRIYREDSLRNQNHECMFCYEPLTYKNVTAEHKIARSKGGGDTKENIGASCVECNKLKDKMSDKEFTNAIKKFPTNKDVRFLLAWSRRKINLQTSRSIKNIKQLFGVQ